MAFNIQTFKTRTLSSIIFVVVMLAGLLWNFWSFCILFTIIHFGCWYEFVRLMKKINHQKYGLYSLWGIIYITLPILLMIDVRAVKTNFSLKNDMEGIIIPMTIIGSMWINDTMAYLVGSLIGKTPFSKISPKKTWEGTIGGIILCIIIVGWLASFSSTYNLSLQQYQWFVIAGIAAIFGTLGDLLESKLKRMAQVKDSGNMMPGHGGFLDRFDSLLVATPFVWLYIKLFVIM